VNEKQSNKIMNEENHQKLTENYRVLIVDDETLGRQRMSQLLDGIDDFSITGECVNGIDAIEWLKTNKVDVVFLDIQMPEISGFEVARATHDYYENSNQRDTMPLIVFVTAFDQYAVEAFRIHAIDYILKPVERVVFADTIARIRGQLENKSNLEPIKKLQQLLAAQQQPPKKYLNVKQGERIFLVPFVEIQWIETEGNYLTIKTSTNEYRLRETARGFIQKYANSATDNDFIQINRSTIINVDFISEIQNYFKGEYAIVLRDGQQLITSTSFRTNLKKILE
jgi:two-component system LytT family response regulator